MHFLYWQWLIILFADDRAKKYGITALSASGKEKYISGAADFVKAAQSWLSYPTESPERTCILAVIPI